MRYFWHGFAVVFSAAFLWIMYANGHKEPSPQPSYAQPPWHWFQARLASPYLRHGQTKMRLKLKGEEMWLEGVYADERETAFHVDTPGGILIIPTSSIEKVLIFK